MKERDSILFFICNDNAAEIERLKKTKRSYIMAALYNKKIQRLNELIASNAQIKHLKEQQKKGK